MFSVACNTHQLVALTGPASGTVITLALTNYSSMRWMVYQADQATFISQINVTMLPYAEISV